MKDLDRSGISQIQDPRRTVASYVHCEILHARSSSANRDLVIQDLRFGMSRQEAMIKSQTAEIHSHQRDFDNQPKIH